MNKKALSAYAELLIKKGVNLQKGEMLVISSPLNAKPLVVEATKIAYKQGASCVEVLWRDDEISKISYKKRSMASLKEVPRWIVEQKDYFIEKRAASLVILSDDPEVLKGVNPKKVAAARRATNKALAKYREFTSSNKLRWSIGGYPNRKWAKKVFPDLTPRAAEDKLWEYIAKTVRLDCDDPIKAWDEHQKAIEKRCEILNSAKIKEFHYKSANGTDFRVAMPKGYIFCGGAEKGALDGVKFTANVPTEEVFSCPDKFTANGKLVASMPLCRNGQIIRDFFLTFKDGRIVDFGAEEGYENLKSIIETDEGSHYLGEIALVGYNSPIRRLETLFYETLYDENASCHFAIGECYPSCIENGENMSEEELSEKGLNDSLEHVDFMVGTKDLSITATTESGKEITVFVGGDWAI